LREPQWTERVGFKSAAHGFEFYRQARLVFIGQDARIVDQHID
jgi:hypothetical protein